MWLWGLITLKCALVNFTRLVCVCWRPDFQLLCYNCNVSLTVLFVVKLLIYKWKIIYTHTHTHIYIYIYIYVHIYKHEHTFIVAMVFVNCWFINGILQTKTCIWSHMYGHNLKNERLICYLEQTIDWILSLKFEHYRFDRQQDVTGHSGGDGDEYPALMAL